MVKHPHLDGESLLDAVRQAARCRASRSHRMEMIPGDPSKRPSFGTLITYRCELCGTVRYDIVQRWTGAVLSRSYDHPDWYLAANETKEEPGWWRAKWWETLPDELFIDATPVTPIRGRRDRKRRTG